MSDGEGLAETKTLILQGKSIFRGTSSCIAGSFQQNKIQDKHHRCL
jgi:hypothetical protein